MKLLKLIWQRLSKRKKSFPIGMDKELQRLGKKQKKR